MESLSAILVRLSRRIALQEQLGGHQTEVLTPLTMAGIAIGFSSGIGRRISSVSADNCAVRMASFGWPKRFCHLGQLELELPGNVKGDGTPFST
jgi:hypothetical protein